MGLWRHAKRKDVVHKPIVDGLRARGVVVFDMPVPGDVLTYWPPADRWMPLELKSDNTVRKKAKGRRGEMTSNNKQKDDARAIIPIAHTLNEALEVLGLPIAGRDA